MFRKMPCILLAMIVVVSVVSPWLPLFYKSILYGISLSLKSFIMFVLPMLIFGLLFKTSILLSKKASKLILFLLAAICVSNFFSTMLSYLVGTCAYRFDLSIAIPNEKGSLMPLYVLFLPKILGNSQAMLAGLCLGIAMGRLRPMLAEKIARYFERYVSIFLKSFLYVIPVFIAGFVVKIAHDGVMGLILRSYIFIFALVAIAVFMYIGFMYLSVNKFQVRGCIRSLKNMLPATIAGFGSMSSAAAMPLTILGTEKNSNNPDVARSVIPVTVNVHLIGDCFAIPIFAFAVMKSFGVSEPTFMNYVCFAVHFVVAKFSVAAVPGGGILVMLPILETYLGFNGEMLSLITALYILFDPMITAANVLGNGGFAMGIGSVANFKTK